MLRDRPQAKIFLDTPESGTGILRTGSKEIFDLPTSAVQFFAYFSFTWWARQARRYVIA